MRANLLAAAAPLLLAGLLVPSPSPASAAPTGSGMRRWARRPRGDGDGDGDGGGGGGGTPPGPPSAPSAPSGAEGRAEGDGGGGAASPDVATPPLGGEPLGGEEKGQAGGGGGGNDSPSEDGPSPSSTGCQASNPGPKVYVLPAPQGSGQPGTMPPPFNPAPPLFPVPHPGLPGSGGEWDRSGLATSLGRLAFRLLLGALLAPGGGGGGGGGPLSRILFGRDGAAHLPDPVQRYTFERVNERYLRDGAALRRALLRGRGRGMDPQRAFWGRPRLPGGCFGRRRRRRRPSLHRRHSLSHRHRRGGGGGGVADDGVASADPPPLRTVLLIHFCTDPSSPLSSSSPHSATGPGAAPQDPIELLRDQVSFVLESCGDPDLRPLLGTEVEVVLLVESGGGGVQDYGLAADAARRVRNAGSVGRRGDAPEDVEESERDPDGQEDGDGSRPPRVALTVCVDRVAASGGYMVASQATPGRLFAAPFAILGSIGVYTSRVNIQELLARSGISGLVLKAGDSKAPIGTIGEITEGDKAAVQRDLERTHEAFRSLVREARGLIPSDDTAGGSGKVMNGEIYLGEQAQRLGLVDRVVTSDEYITERLRAGDNVLRLKRYDKPRSFGGIGLSPLDLLHSEGLLGRMKGRLSSLGLSTATPKDILAVTGAAAGLLGLLRELGVGFGDNVRVRTGDFDYLRAATFHE